VGKGIWMVSGMERAEIHYGSAIGAVIAALVFHFIGTHRTMGHRFHADVN
jgi:hypothetical protein